MAQYLLLEFDNDAQCSRMIEKLSGMKAFRVVGLFQKPVRFCECPEMNQTFSDFEGRFYNHRKLRRGGKFGWMVHHPGCHRPIKTMVSPKNLLDNNPDPVWAHERQPTLSLTPNFPLTIPRNQVI